MQNVTISILEASECNFISTTMHSFAAGASTILGLTVPSLVQTGRIETYFVYYPDNVWLLKVIWSTGLHVYVQ